MIGPLALTLAAYGAGVGLQRWFGRAPWANPVLAAIAIVAAALGASGTPYARYFAGAWPISALLGPATVALAVPLARNAIHIRRCFHGVGLALVAGAVASVVTGAATVWALGGSHAVVASMAAKGATTPVAMAIAQQSGGIATLTASLAIAGGIVAATLGRSVLTWLRVDDWRAHGFAAGVAGSGVAAAQIAPVNAVAAAFAALGIALNALATSLIVPALAGYWRG